MPNLSCRLMKNFMLGILFSIGFSTSIFAQQAPQLSLFTQNSPYLNPALSGIDGETYALLHYRNQWTSYQGTQGQTGNLGTQILAFSSPLTIPNMGLSAFLLNDRTPSGAGQIYGFIQPAYHKPVGDGKLSLGLKLGMMRKTLDGTNYSYRDPNDPLLDPLLNQIASSAAFVPGLGIAYGNETYQFGLTYDYLTNVFIDSDPSIQQHSQIQIHGNYLYFLTNSLDLNPFFLVRYYHGQVLPEAGVRVGLNGTIWMGGSYRMGDAAIGMIGLNLKDNKISLGYALDYTLVNQSVKSPLSHEVFIRFNLPKFEKKVKWLPVKTPRFNYILE